MAKGKGVDLHAVLAAYNKVEKALKVHKKGATAEQRDKLNALLEKVGSARLQASSLCPRVQSLWPESESGEGKASRLKRKPGSRK